MTKLDLDAPQIGEYVWHTFTADATIEIESKAHRDRIEAAVAAHLPELDWRQGRLLELGAYRHYTGHMLAADRGCEVFITDIAAPALRDGREQARSHGVSAAATPVVADFHDLPFSSDYFDVVFVAASVHHTRRPETVLRQMLRVLKPGGLLILGNEPCARTCCFHAFACNRAESLTPFEARLNDARLLPTLSSPFWGARPEHLFGMVENDRIPLSLYMEAFAASGSVLERTLSLHGLVGPLEQRIMQIDASGDSLQANVRDLLRGAVAEAAALYGPTERLLGYRLPTECEVHELAARVAGLLQLRTAAADDVEWQARMFGAAISAVVRKHDAGFASSQHPFHRDMLFEPDGLVRERPDEGTLAAELGTPLMPDIQHAQDAASLGAWFPPEDWHWARDERGLATLANLVPAARIEIAPRPAPTLLAIRYFAVVTDGLPYRVRVWAGGDVLDEQLIVLQESRLIRGVVPADCAEIVVEIVSDDARVDAPWRVRVGVCQLFVAE